MSEQHSGGCLCGAIRYQMHGVPTSVNICYCTQCQKQSGAPMPAFASCRAEQLELSSGSPVNYRSSERAVRQFCGACGSTLFWREDDGSEIDVFLGTFDEPQRLPPPGYAIWAEHRLRWVPEVAGAQAFPGRRSA